MTGRLMEAVEHVARLAGDVALTHYRRGVTVRVKPDGSEVTDADIEAERVARAWIGAAFPEDGILGEELGVTNAEAQRRWLLDPIDGTVSFTRGVPLWGTLVAVADGEAVLAGAIYCPAVQELVCAAVHEGCWWNGRRSQVSAIDRLDRATVLTSSAHVRDPAHATAWDALSGSARRARTWGDCYGYLLVATGRADVMVDPVLNDWDSAALLPVITEAGGVFTDWSGRVTGFGRSAIASNASLAQDCRATLARSAR